MFHELSVQLHLSILGGVKYYADKDFIFKLVDIRYKQCFCGY
ncbi:hypothetical protein BHY_0585 [Borrelia nietonii YOR]|uniref:Uncharacterized protein n=1 Tax=Borrelia nietonii YOR TaxID=1293576 RepID=A0ABM5PHZ4_9SPIR|nr:hypothetical protein BHY_0585 [Borrelia nietonii YOR]AHH14043.1 hypothetical protein BHW_0900083 [Borrelia hermsii MTW]